MAVFDICYSEFHTITWQYREIPELLLCPLPTPFPTTSAQPTWPGSTLLLPKQMPLGPFSGQRKDPKRRFKQALVAASVVLRDYDLGA